MMPNFLRPLLKTIVATLVGVATLTLTTPALAQTAGRGVPRDQCFPLEELPEKLRPKAEALLLKLLDSEGLFTVIGGMKPMSSGFGNYKINTKRPDMTELNEARQILATFRCGNDYLGEVLPFHRTQKDERFFEAVFFHRPSVGEMVRTYADFFGPYGITENTDPFGIALIIENDPTTARNRGLGYLYGYPKYAVDFFVSAADEMSETKKFVQRDFINIPVFESPKGRFVYAVPKGYQEAEVDKNLREKAAKILAAYTQRRAKYIGPGKPGPAALLRDWLDDGTGFCAAANAKY